MQVVSYFTVNLYKKKMKEADETATCQNLRDNHIFLLKMH